MTPCNPTYANATEPQRRRARRGWTGALSLLAGGLLACATVARCAELAVGAPMPVVQAMLLDGATRMRVGGGPGKVTIVNFWATWCAPCRAEMPAIQAYYERHRDQGLEVLAISMDDPRHLAEVRKIASAFDFAIALKRDADFRSLGRIWRMPSTFVVDREGVLRKNGHEGDPTVDVDSLEALVTPLLQTH